MKKKIAVVLALALVFSFALSACGSEKKAEKTKLEQIKDAKVLVMYTNAEFPPYEFLGEGEEIIGVDIEIGKAIAKELGVELKIENAEFDSIVASISSGKGDVAITGLTITEERKQQVDFSPPYVDSVQYLILPNDSDIETMEDLAGKSIGAQTGTTGEMLVQEEIDNGVLKDKKTTLVQHKSAPTAMQDLIVGRIDAVVIDELVAIEIAAQNDSYKAMPFVYETGTPVTEQFGVAIKKGNEDLLRVIDKVINELLASGQIEAWIEEYSGDKYQ
jgi:polar amino acid transport system substrate-binding protein